MVSISESVNIGEDILFMKKLTFLFALLLCFNLLAASNDLLRVKRGMLFVNGNESQLHPLPINPFMPLTLNKFESLMLINNYQRNQLIRLTKFNKGRRQLFKLSVKPRIEGLEDYAYTNSKKQTFLFPDFDSLNSVEKEKILLRENIKAKTGESYQTIVEKLFSLNKYDFDFYYELSRFFNNYSLLVYAAARDDFEKGRFSEEEKEAGIALIQFLGEEFIQKASQNQSQNWEVGSYFKDKLSPSIEKHLQEQTQRRTNSSLFQALSKISKRVRVYSGQVHRYTKKAIYKKCCIIKASLSRFKPWNPPHFESFAGIRNWGHIDQETLEEKALMPWQKGFLKSKDDIPGFSFLYYKDN